MWLPMLALLEVQAAGWQKTIADCCLYEDISAAGDECRDSLILDSLQNSFMQFNQTISSLLNK
jgi:hypothetical protein